MATGGMAVAIFGGNVIFGDRGAITQQVCSLAAANTNSGMPSIHLTRKWGCSVPPSFHGLLSNSLSLCLEEALAVSGLLIGNGQLHLNHPLLLGMLGRTCQHKGFPSLQWPFQLHALVLSGVSPIGNSTSEHEPSASVAALPFPSPSLPDSLPPFLLPSHLLSNTGHVPGPFFGFPWFHVHPFSPLVHRPSVGECTRVGGHVYVKLRVL